MTVSFLYLKSSPKILEKQLPDNICSFQKTTLSSLPKMVFYLLLLHVRFLSAMKFLPSSLHVYKPCLLSHSEAESTVFCLLLHLVHITSVHLSSLLWCFLFAALFLLLCKYILRLSFWGNNV